jgi:hypothetical protein
MLHGISSDIMREILDYAYTGQVDIKKENVRDLLVASDYLSALSLREVCCNFLKETLDVETCISLLHFAR